MTRQFSDAVRNALADAYETAVGVNPIMRIYDLTAGAPANCAAAAVGTVLAEITLPADWLTAAAGGSKSMLGTWQDPTANAPGTADFFRVYASNGSTCHDQGTVTATGGGGDMTVDNTSFALNQPINITNFAVTAGGA